MEQFMLFFFIEFNVARRYNKHDASGIYIITCTANNKSYIGQAYHVWDRLVNKHRYMLVKNKHPNKHMQASFNKYGMDTFEWSIYKACTIDKLNDEEMMAIAALGRENLFNFTDGGSGMKRFTHSKESKQKIKDTKMRGGPQASILRQK
jgi:group I intron endonuclease